MSVRMNRAEVAQKLCVLAAGQVDADPTQVTLDTHLHGDLGFDSLDDAEYLMTIEEAFGVDIPNRDASSVETVGHALEALWPIVTAAGVCG